MYFVRETWISLRRNLMMTIAGIITVMISLCLFGGIRLVKDTVDHGTEKWKHGVQLEIFMKVKSSKNAVGASDQQISDMKNALAHDPNVKSYHFVDHPEAYDRFKKEFANNPALLETVTPDVLPVSFLVVPQTAKLTQNIDLAYRDYPGVDSINTAAEAVKRLLSVTHWISVFFVVISVALLLSSLFLIVNTIRLATFARRREIEVMRLVGASNWFVRIPFMAEGFVQGIVGAGLAFGIVFVLKVVISDFVHPSQTNLLSTFRVTDTDALGVGILILLIGAGIGILGSAIGLRRFLDT
jgi:cell division transport system permease protein